MSQATLTSAERVAALQHLGYSDREAQFLSLAALHGGYFLRRQYVQFLGKAVGGTAAGLIEKALAKGHAKGSTYAGGTHIYHLCARPFYAALGQEDNRNRRLRQPLSIKSKLMSLDFVLAHPDVQYLATEQEKLDYFLQEPQLDRLLLPSVRYAARGKLTRRYFVEKFPLFLAPSAEAAVPPVASFCFIDEGAVGTSGLVTFLRKYHSLFKSLKEFRFIFVAATDAHFDAARRLFERHLDPKAGTPELVPDGSSLSQLLEHFQARRRFEAHEWDTFDRAKLIRFRDDCAVFSGPKFDGLYRLWLAEGEASLRTFLIQKPTSETSVHGVFSTYLLKENYDLFGNLAAE